ncbi:MAG: ABC transporter permease [Rhodanobacteraceae bacterium]
MLSYYLNLALRSLKRNRVLTGLMVLAIALGIGAAMTTLTVLHVLSGDPLPDKSAHLYYPQIDPQDMDGYQPDQEPPAQVSWIDGMNLLKAGRADRQALMTAGGGAVEIPGSDKDPALLGIRATSSQFFPMFKVPMLYGHAWGEQEDRNRDRVVVLTRKINDKLFGGQDSTGKSVTINNKSLQVIGVMDTWRPNPHFYDLNTGNYGSGDDVFVPLTTSRDLDMGHNGSMDCWGKGMSDPSKLESAPCIWLQFWVELDTPAKAASYKQFLVNYSRQQKELGRFERPPNVRLPDLMQWLDINKVVPSDVRLQTWLAFGFLLVCLVNTVGLLLAKFLRGSGELGVRRALGASRREVFAQLLVEAGMVGMVGGLCGLLLALGGLWLVRQQPARYADLAHLDVPMLLLTLALALGASLLAGLLPAWRACRIAPALQLKSQ